MAKQRTNVVVDDNIIAIFNARRDLNKGLTFTQKEIIDELKHLDYATNTNMLRALTDGENPPIVKIERGKYVFNPEPVYKERLQKSFDLYTTFAKAKTRVLSEDECINFLKSTGKYEIYLITRKLVKI